MRSGMVLGEDGDFSKNDQNFLPLPGHCCQGTCSPSGIFQPTTFNYSTSEKDFWPLDRTKMKKSFPLKFFCRRKVLSKRPNMPNYFPLRVPLVQIKTTDSSKTSSSIISLPLKTHPIPSLPPKPIPSSYIPSLLLINHSLITC